MEEYEYTMALLREKRLQDQLVDPVIKEIGAQTRLQEQLVDPVTKEIEETRRVLGRLSAPVTVTSKKIEEKDRVFIVHGRDDSTKMTIAQFLKDLGLEPIILHEQPNKGRTLIEKFEDHSNVVYAVVLLTPDDLGGLVSEPNNQSPRARQNVIFEMGHFFGRLGRGRVCALLSSEVERPSDIDGILYIPMDQTGEWKGSLLRELKEAGLKVQEIDNSETVASEFGA